MEYPLHNFAKWRRDVKKWMNEIGFSNPRHYRKYQMWKTKYNGNAKEKIAEVTQPGRVSVAGSLPSGQN